MTAVVSTYLNCWNTVDPAERRVLVERHFAADARYIDPLVDVRGHAGILATIAAVHEQFPDAVFTPLGAPDAHHDQVRFGWGLGPSGAVPLVEGFDVVVTDPDGRIAAVYGFLDKVPAA